MSENTVKTASKLTEATFKTLSNLYGDLYEAVHKYTDQEGDARPEAADDINDRLNRLGQGIASLAPPKTKRQKKVKPVEVAHAENVVVSGEPGVNTTVQLQFNPAPAEGEPHFTEVENTDPATGIDNDVLHEWQYTPAPNGEPHFTKTTS